MDDDDTKSVILLTPFWPLVRGADHLRKLNALAGQLREVLVYKEGIYRNDAVWDFILALPTS